MDRRMAFASICAACIAALVFSIYPDMSSLVGLCRIWELRELVSNATIPTDADAAERPWNLLYHLGGNGPWIPKIDGIVEGGIGPPKGCSVEQVHMISRHAERYPTLAVGTRMLALHRRIREANTTLQGDLAFANDWEFFSTQPADDLDSLVSTGPYAGTLEAFNTGVKLRTRYKSLLDEALERGAISFWASDSTRVIDTARYFGAGFFGIGNEDQTKLLVIPETADRGADTLTPGRTCLRYRNNSDDFGHDYGYRMMDKIRSTYEPATAQRLAEQNPEMPFSEDEVMTMQLICGFETIAKGSSQWCHVFTQEEMESHEYARDVIHYYRTGPGNPYSASLGWLWLNATASLLNEGPAAGPLFFSFVHDGDIIPILTALDLLPQTPDLPTTHIPLHNRTWRTSDTVPMGGRLLLERLSCPLPQHCWSNAPFYPNHVYCEPPQSATYVRVNLNDGIVAMPGCDDGPGGSCPLEMFSWLVQRRGSEIDEFRYACGLEREAPGGITFLHQ